MDNIDFIHRTEKPSSRERNKINPEFSTDIQIRLPLIMIREYVDEKLMQSDLVTNERFLDDLLSRFMEKYVIDYNGLDSYCAYSGANPLLLARLQSGEYTESDLVVLSDFIQSSSPDNKFFKDASEAQEFIRKYSN